jgi:hypothetical protein
MGAKWERIKEILGKIGAFVRKVPGYIGRILGILKVAGAVVEALVPLEKVLGTIAYGQLLKVCHATGIVLNTLQDRKKASLIAALLELDEGKVREALKEV